MVAVNVSEASGTSEARRRAATLASSLNFNENDAGKLAIVVSEIATNLVKHCRGGEIFLRPLRAHEGGAIEVLGVDSGPGIADVAMCLRDGHSSAGTSGTGLGAITRLAAIHEIHSVPEAGTVVRAICTTKTAILAAAAGYESGCVVSPKPGEQVCGDAVTHHESETGIRVLVADGLGHGVFAAEASKAAVEAFHRAAARELPAAMDQLHTVLRPTRGAAVAMAELRPNENIVRFCGIGNIAGVIASGDKTTHMVSMNGIVGHQIRSIRSFEYPWQRDSLLVMHSDGVSSRWSMSSYPGLRQRSASVVAAVLYRDARRRSDDASVVVMKAK